MDRKPINQLLKDIIIRLWPMWAIFDRKPINQLMKLSLLSVYGVLIRGETLINRKDFCKDCKSCQSVEKESIQTFSVGSDYRCLISYRLPDSLQNDIELDFNEVLL